MLWLGGGGAALGGQCDMLGCRGDTEDGPGTLTGTHAPRAPHSARCCAARSPAQVPGREMCPHTARRAAAARSNTRPTRAHTGRGSDFYQRMEWARDHSFIRRQTLVSSASYIH